MRPTPSPASHAAATVTVRARSCLRGLVRAVSLLAALLPAAAATAQSPIAYTLTIDPGDLSRFSVALFVPADAVAAGQVRLSIPDWAPGAYRLTGAWKSISDVRALDAAGTPLPMRKDGDLDWVIDAPGSGAFLVAWEVAAGSSPNNRHYLTRTCALVDGPRTYMAIRGAEKRRVEVEFRIPEGWRVATGLDPADGPRRYAAADYDTFIDCPTLAGRFLSFGFDARGVPHRIAIDHGDRMQDFDEKSLLDAIRRIAEFQIDLMGSMPCRHYTFIYTPGGGGGLEHLNSTTIGIGAPNLGGDVTSLLAVTAHEYFHLWNVKRIRPVELGPFDYSKPARTRCLWISEGITDYYTELTLVRTGLITPAAFVERLGAAILRHRNNPARLTMSPEESSLTVWDREGPESGASISYYLQGMVLGLLLDIEIRASTENQRSLDTLFRALLERHAGERGFTAAEFEEEVSRAAGRSMSDFFRRFVAGTEEIPWNEFLERAGFRADLIPLRIRDPGVAVREDGDRLVAEGDAMSAFAAAGLRSGDLVQRINGHVARTRPDFLRELARATPEGRIQIDVLRNGKPSSVRITAEPDSTLDLPLRTLPGGELEVLASSDPALLRRGLRDGDVLLKVGSRRISRRGDIADAMRKVREDAVEITVRRDRAKLPFTLPVRHAAPVVGGLAPLQNPLPTARLIGESILRGTTTR